MESLRRKVGLAFRATGMGLALSTNCSVWTLTPEEEKLLGEGIGDVCHDLGLGDTLAVKFIFALGVVGGVFGPKAIGYLSFVEKQRLEAERVKKGKDSPPQQPAPGRVAAAGGPGPASVSELHDTPPGLI